MVELCSLNPLNAELNPICLLLALLRAHHILHISRIRVNIYGQRSSYIRYETQSRNQINRKWKKAGSLYMKKRNHM